MDRNEFIKNFEASVDALCNEFYIDKDYFIGHSVIMTGGSLLLCGYVDETNDIDIVCSEEIYNRINVPEKDGFFGKYKKYNDMCEISSYEIFDMGLGTNINSMIRVSDAVDINGKTVYCQRYERVIWMKLMFIDEIMKKEYRTDDLEERERLYNIRNKKIEGLLKIKDKVLEENKRG